MDHSSKKLQLVWDINKLHCHINGVEIAVAPPHLAPFKTDALIEEQDTALVLGESEEIRDPGEKPAWYLANKLESQVLLTPGEVIVRDTTPLRLQAVVHDLDAVPSCSELWIFQAIQQVFEIAGSRGFASLQIPMLGCRFSNLQTGQFLGILLQIITRQRPSPINKLWLLSTEQDCEAVFAELAEKARQYR